MSEEKSVSVYGYIILVNSSPEKSSCPACNGNTELASQGVLAPFVASLLNLPIGQPSQLRQCNECDLFYFDYRYSDDEMGLLYGDYRGSHYSAVRHHWEPWYSSKVNDAFTPGNEAVRDRVDFMTSVLRRAGMPEKLNCAVDFGGDQGQFFPELPISRKVVYDVSDQVVTSGVDRISTLSDVANEKVDLVIVAHVLEHLADPREPLLEIRKILSDGILYVEVPLDRPKLRKHLTSESYRRYLKFIATRRWFFILMDFVTGIWRQFNWRVPSFGVVKQSEHINYFDSDSIHSLLGSTGYRIVTEQHDVGYKGSGLRTGRYGIAARLI